MSKAPKPQFAKSQIGLILWLVPILVAWGILILNVPIGFFLNGDWELSIDHESQTARILSRGWGNWPQEIAFDPQAGTLNQNPTKRPGNTSTQSDSKSNLWRTVAIGKYYVYDRSPDDRQWLADGPKWGVTRVIDKESGLEVAKIKSTWNTTKFLNRNSAIAISPKFGWTFQQFSTQDGSEIQNWNPFWWVLPLLLPSVLGFVIWSLFWLRRTGPSTIHVWATILVLSVIPLLAFTTRVRLVGDKFDLGRGPIQYGQGIVLALLLLSTVWVINSKQRIVFRLLPMLVSLAILPVAATQTFSETLRFVAIGITQMAIPMIFLAFAFLVFRLFGYRLSPIKPDLDSNDELTQDLSNENSVSIQENTTQVTIQDMFLIVGGLALVFAAMAPLLPSIYRSLGEPERLIQIMGPLIAGAALQVFAWWLVMTGKKTGVVKFSIVAIIFLLLLAEPVFCFASGVQYCPVWAFQFNWSPELIRLALAAFVSTFWLGLAFRYGGWRWERISDRQ